MVYPLQSLSHFLEAIVGIYVVQTESGKYFISYSDFVAKEFRNLHGDL